MELLGFAQENCKFLRLQYSEIPIFGSGKFMDVRFSTKNFYIVSEKFVVLFPYDFSNHHPSPSKFWGGNCDERLGQLYAIIT